MSLEQKIEELTAAVTALTAAMKSGATAGAGAAAAVTDKKPTTAKADKAAAYEPKHTKEEMQAALAEVKERLGTPAAKAIIKDVGKAEKMAEITDPKLVDACYDAAKEKLQEADEAM